MKLLQRLQSWPESRKKLLINTIVIIFGIFLFFLFFKNLQIKWKTTKIESLPIKIDEIKVPQEIIDAQKELEKILKESEKNESK
jgi:uncharacterized membrane protein